MPENRGGPLSRGPAMDENVSFAELMRRMRAGEAEATAIVQRLIDGLKAQARRHLSSRIRQDASSAAQSAWVSFLAKEDRLNEDRLWAQLLEGTLLRHCEKRNKYVQRHPPPLPL